VASDSCHKSEQELNQYTAVIFAAFRVTPREITEIKHWLVLEVALFIPPAYA
jgi:hypothetical protein